MLVKRHALGLSFCFVVLSGAKPLMDLRKAQQVTHESEDTGRRAKAQPP